MKLKKNNIYLVAFSALLLSCGGAPESENSSDDKLITDVYPDTSTCDCETDWFNGGLINAPAEGPSSVFGSGSTINCEFHQWSWQKFLYITQSNTPGGAPYFLTNMDQVTSEMTPITSTNGLVLTEKTQAGGNGLLTTNTTYGTSGEMVYYSIHIDSTFKTAAEGFNAMIKAQPDSVNNRQSFPVGALELKVSWVDVAAMPASDTSNYFVTNATINGTPSRVAMLGMHVVGVVENHPEFIWATFEHNGLAPHYDWAGTTTADLPVTSPDNSLLFNSDDEANIQNITWIYGDTTPRDPNDVFSVYKYGTPVVPGGGFLTTTSQTNGQENYDNIEHINKSVYDTLTARNISTKWLNYFYDGSIWMNTDGMTHDQQITAILARVNNFGDVSANGPLRGSMAAANISMETYEQIQNTDTIHTSGNANLVNCLVCHGPSSFLPIAGVSNAQSATYISHIFMNYMYYNDPTKTLKATSVEAFRKMRIKMFEALRQKQTN